MKAKVVVEDVSFSGYARVSDSIRIYRKTDGTYLVKFNVVWEYPECISVPQLFHIYMCRFLTDSLKPYIDHLYCNNIIYLEGKFTTPRGLYGDRWFEVSDIFDTPPPLKELNWELV